MPSDAVDATDPIDALLDLGGHGMPGLWRFLLPEDAQWMRWPGEALATCHDCFRTALGECHPESQCCTYFPELPNYTVGHALKSPTAAARMRAARASWLPQGLIPSPRELHRAADMQAGDTFGTRPEMNCPFLVSGTRDCAIYPYRNSVCSTFFCENDHGDAGASLWGRVQILVGHLETILAQWAMERLDLGVVEYHGRLDALSEDIDAVCDAHGWTEDARRHLWGDWFGRQEEFFERCAIMVRTHRARLFEIASAAELVEARTFEAAVRAWLPEPARSEVPPVSQVAPTPIAALWYKLQLENRRLWALPFGDGVLALSAETMIAPNSQDDLRARALAHEAWTVTLGDQRIFLGDAEATALRYFEVPRVLGEASLESPELTALDDARGFLAQCVQRGILLHRQSKS